MSKKFCVSLEKENLIFSAAHFITFETVDGKVVCEQLHGHNYRVKCEVAGALNEHGYVVDFIALSTQLKKMVAELDHHVVLPTMHPEISVVVKEAEVEVKFGEKRWVFPQEDCCLLPISNTTAELMAGYLCDQLLDSGMLDDSIDEVMVAVDENEGQWGECVMKRK